MKSFDYPPFLEGTNQDRIQQLYRYLFELTDRLNELAAEIEKLKGVK